VATHFSRLLRHAWVTVGLFLFPGHQTGITGTKEAREFLQYKTLVTTVFAIAAKIKRRPYGQHNGLHNHHHHNQLLLPHLLLILQTT
jgi:hypothetical protein